MLDLFGKTDWTGDTLHRVEEDLLLAITSLVVDKLFANLANKEMAGIFAAEMASDLTARVPHQLQ